MQVHLITGGARSGKSFRAEWIARRLGGDDVTYIATARAADEEMTRRIERHRRQRPAAWKTIECPTGADRAVLQADTDVVLLDCVTTLTANAIARVGARSEDSVTEAMVDEVQGLVDAARAREGHLIVVTNEVGWGLHPETELGRWYRDGLGLANRMLAQSAVTVTIMVCGRPLQIPREA